MSSLVCGRCSWRVILALPPADVTEYGAHDLRGIVILRSRRVPVSRETKSLPPCVLRPHGCAPLLPFTLHFGVTRRRPNFNRTAAHWVFRHQLDGVVQIPGLDDPESSQLLLRFRVWPVGHRHFSILQTQSGCVSGVVEPFPANDVAIFPEF